MGTRRTWARAAVAMAAVATLATGAPAAGAEARSAGQAPVDLVRPFAGTAGGGNAFPGPASPFGMVQLSPDTGYWGGYRWEDSTIEGFSHTKLSGGGCGGMGDVPFMPTTGDIVTDPGQYRSSFRHESEQAEPGYYAVELDRYDVTAELTATTRTGWHAYTFPATEQANVLVNIGNAVGATYDSSVRIVGDDTIEGQVTDGEWCGGPSRYTVYFHAKFDRPFASYGTWRDGRVTAGSRASSNAGYNASNGAYLRFDTAAGNRTVKAKVGLSYVSTEGAARNLAAEAQGFDFAATRAAAAAAWARELDRIDVGGGSQAERETFYTALYHALLHPSTGSDVDGRYRGFDGKVHTMDGGTYYQTYSLWDTYRPQNPLLALLQPRRSRDMYRSLLRIHEEGGWLPRWSLATTETNVMVGDPVTPFLVEGWSKGLLSGHERQAYEALLANVTELPPADSQFNGRAGNREWAELGYVPLVPDHPGKPVDVDPRWGGSATLEYAVSDCALSLMASAIGERRDAAMLATRAQNYRNLFDRTEGFFRPRNADGSWVEPYSPTDSPGFHEGEPWQYMWLAPQDPEGIVELLGRDTMVERLDHFFGFPELEDDPAGVARNVWAVGWWNYYGSSRYNPNNEPDLHAPWLYAYVGQPWKTTDVVRAQQTLFGATPGGMTGNDDLGTMSAWYVFSTLGIYPMMSGSGGYQLHTPSFERIEVHPDGRRSFSIEAPGVSETNRYVDSVTVDGRRSHRSWIAHDVLLDGGTVRFAVGAEPSGWGTLPRAAQPSSCDQDRRPARLTGAVDPARLQVAADRRTDETVTLKVMATAHGDVAGRVRATAPAGITVEPVRAEFAVRSDMLPVQAEIPFTVRVAPTVTVGEHDVEFHVSARNLTTTARMTIEVLDHECEAGAAMCPLKLDGLFNNDGIATADDPDDGNFDGIGWSYRGEELPAAGTHTLAGVQWRFPGHADGALNNIETHRQVIPAPGGRHSTLHVLGAAHFGGVDTQGRVTYTDGTSADIPFRVSDWAWNPPAYGERIAVQASGRYQIGVGPTGPPVALFAQRIALDPAKEIRSLTLPEDARLHVFAATLEAAG